MVRFGDVERVEGFDPRLDAVECEVVESLPDSRPLLICIIEEEVLVLPFPRLGPGVVALDGEGHQFAERGDGRVVTDSRSDDALPSANVAASVSLGPGALPS